MKLSPKLLALAAAACLVPLSLNAQQQSPSDYPSSNSNATGTNTNGTGSAASSGSTGSSSGMSSADTSMSKGSGKLSSTDRKFVMMAAQGSKAEVELGQLAQQKASDPQVKQFGQRMVDDHTKALDQLKKVASEEQLNLPDQPEAKEQKEKDRLSSMSGADFDKAYMQHMVKDHKKDVSEFQKAASSASDPEVKNFAQSTLPTLQEHLQLAQQIAPKVGATSSANSSDQSSNQAKQ